MKAYIALFIFFVGCGESRHQLRQEQPQFRDVKINISVDENQQLNLMFFKPTLTSATGITNCSEKTFDALLPSVTVNKYDCTDHSPKATLVSATFDVLGQITVGQSKYDENGILWALEEGLTISIFDDAPIETNYTLRRVNEVGSETVNLEGEDAEVSIKVNVEDEIPCSIKAIWEAETLFVDIYRDKYDLVDIVFDAPFKDVSNREIDNIIDPLLVPRVSFSATKDELREAVADIKTFYFFVANDGYENYCEFWLTVNNVGSANAFYNQ